MTNTSVSAAQAAELMTKVDQKLTELQQALGSFIADVNKIIPQLPLPLQSQIHPYVQRYWTLGTPAIKWLRDYMNSSVWPSTMLEISDAWYDQIYQNATRTAHIINRKHLGVDDFWQGSAARNYKKTLGKQHTASNDMALLAEHISDGVSAVANSCIDFWTAVLVAVLGALGAVLGAAVSVATVVGAVVGVLVAVITFVGVIVNAVNAHRAQVNTTIKTIRNFRMEIDNNATFPSSRWPKATTKGTWSAD